MKYQTDDAIVREVFADKKETEREKELATRLYRLLGALDRTVTEAFIDKREIH